MVAEALARRSWRSVDAPDDVLSVPTMLAADEQALLYTLARDYATGEGAIVDAGCFLGGSSSALLAGMCDREKPWDGPPLVSYDLFRVEEYTLDEFFADEPEMEVGSSFRSVYDRHVAGFGLPHVVVEGDITAHGWTGGPIEILFLDVLKTPAINDAVMRDFLPHVIPGRTVIVHQDYEWGHVPWLHVTVELMRDSLRWIDAVPHCTHMFLVERPLPEGLLDAAAWQDIPDERKLEAIDRAIARNDGDACGMLMLSKALLLATQGRLSDASALLDSVERQYDSSSVASCAEGIRVGVDAALERWAAPVESSRAGPGSMASARLPPDLPRFDLELSEPAGAAVASAVTALVREFGEAVADGDARRARATLSSDLLGWIQASFGAGAGRDPVEVLATMVGDVPADRRLALRALEVTDVRVQAGHAFAICELPASATRVWPARLETGDWKIAMIAGLPLG